MKRRGGCLCGEVSVEISADFELVEFCHCRTCRRAVGAPIAAWAGVLTADLAIEGDSLRRFESSPGVERAFCGRCGTSLSIRADAYPDMVYVAITALDDAASITPEVHIWRSERLPWLETADALPRYIRFKFEGELE